MLFFDYATALRMYWRIQILEQVLSSLLIKCVSVCVCVPHIATIIILCGHSLSLLWSINNLNHIFIDRLLIYLPRIPINPKQQSPFLRISMRPISAAHSPRAAWEQCERGRGVCESALFASLRQQVRKNETASECARAAYASSCSRRSFVVVVNFGSSLVVVVGVVLLSLQFIRMRFLLCVASFQVRAALRILIRRRRLLVK